MFSKESPESWTRSEDLYGAAYIASLPGSQNGTGGIK